MEILRLILDHLGQVSSDPEGESLDVPGPGVLRAAVTSHSDSTSASVPSSLDHVFQHAGQVTVGGLGQWFPCTH